MKIWNKTIIEHFLTMTDGVIKEDKISPVNSDLTAYSVSFLGGETIHLGYDYGRAMEKLEDIAKDTLANLFAEKYGIIDYKIKGSELIYEVCYTISKERYKCFVSLSDFRETRKQMKYKLVANQNI